MPQRTCAQLPALKLAVLGGILMLPGLLAAFADPLLNLTLLLLGVLSLSDMSGHRCRRSSGPDAALHSLSHIRAALENAV
jgi:hypothetical protein